MKLKNKKIILDGSDWRMNYFRPAVRQFKGGAVMSTLWLADGAKSGAHRRDYDDSSWWPGTVPGDVRTVLMANKEMEDPFYGRNSDKCRWVEDFEWWFRKKFVLPEEMKDKKVRICFKGVDLFATYWLNGTKLGKSSDMFVPVTFDITKLVEREGENILAVRLSPPPKSDSNHYWNGKIPKRAYFHKSQVSWGWDWSREMVTIGIWDSVDIYAYDGVCLNDVFVQAVPTLDHKEATLDVGITLQNDSSEQEYVLKVEIKDETGTTVIQKTDRVLLTKGSRLIRNQYFLKNPHLWWPNGYGSQNLYDCKVEVRKDNKLCHEKSISFGVRNIKMIRNPGSTRDAYPLTFCVNDRKIFCRGGNWAPPDMLFGRIREDRYRYLIQCAQNIGFNMLRVWGGGLVEKESFYDLCDRCGILVWQEFPLCCAKYPKNKKFVAEKEIEAEAIIKKLRSHPSIALYCGGNELFYYCESSQSPVLQMFKRKVSELHPMIDYHFSSPDKEREGERPHGPWLAQKKNHQFWNKHFRNFASELGCNAMPTKETLDKIIPSNESYPDGLSFRHHFIPAEHYYHHYGHKIFNSTSLKEDVFFSQFLQADTLQYIYGHYRANSWKSSGCLIWAYNAAWPEGAWSIIDYYGTPKIAYYWLKEVCQPVCIHVADRDWELGGNTSLKSKIFLINQSDQTIPNYLLEIKIISESGYLPTKIYEVAPVKMDTVSKPIVLVQSLTKLPGDLVLLKISWKTAKKVVAVTNRWYARKKWLDLSCAAKNFLMRQVAEKYHTEKMFCIRTLNSVHNKQERIR